MSKIFTKLKNLGNKNSDIAILIALIALIVWRIQYDLTIITNIAKNPEKIPKYVWSQIYWVIFFFLLVYFGPYLKIICNKSSKHAYAVGAIIGLFLIPKKLDPTNPLLMIPILFLITNDKTKYPVLFKYRAKYPFLLKSCLLAFGVLILIGNICVFYTNL